MDRDANRFFLVQDHETLEGADVSAVPDDAFRVNVLVKCPDGEPVETYAKQFEEEQLPVLCSAAGAVASCLFGTLQSTDNHAAVFDLVAEIALEAEDADREALRDRALQIEESGARVVIVAVNRHESALS
jgi:predicted dinucleotide-utilizing enzyme